MALVLLGVLSAWTLANGARRPLVVYCAHDALYAEEVLRAFEEETGIDVEARFDTEATKSLGLVELVARERDRPRCDVLWNNEHLGTVRLAEEGLLLPYRGPGYGRIPSPWKDPGGRWTGFAARLRVWIFNRERMTPAAGALAAALEGDLTRAAIAKPLWGTTRTHYTVLYELWGGAGLRAWHGEWRQRGIREVSGNATVKNLVAAGVCDFGLTDSDDYFVAVDAGHPVAMLPFRVPDGSTICIPNTVAIVAGSRRIDDARRLVDFLLSARTELRLARSRARQIPLGPADAEALPEDVRALLPFAAAGYPLAGLENASSACLAWLRSEYLR